ncbi:MAG: 2-succinyl-5-enolpyruvyl-6-hydroxy-3-cyclohexene-1-carboxylic-acid synthase [bacterium]|nr:2-succinyl-5-enolpyruvyl-6-hydroxy-3-cyclohexene-1-carboxylic-acid synthase [bacterium]
MNVPNPNYLQAELLWRQLHAAEVRHAVISPGARSTPLARIAVLNESLTCHVITDERSAGFFALGLAKATHCPVALVCTSGTAAAHYYPAIIEAAQSGIPLVVLSADRPVSLRNTGAPQTIDQSGLFGRFAKMMIDLPVPRPDEQAMRDMLYWVKAALRAMHQPPYAPVHINVQMAEPLAPEESDSKECQRLLSPLHSIIEPIAPHTGAACELDREFVDTVQSACCGLIVCGPDAARSDQERDAIHALARNLGWPLFADVCSGLRFCGEPNLPFYDLFLRTNELAQLAPDCVIEFGNYPTSKPLNSYLNEHRARTFRIQRDALPRDPDARAAKITVCEVSSSVQELIATIKVSRDSLLLNPFWRAAGALHAASSRYTLNKEAELGFVQAALNNLPNDAQLVLASSMPIRYADMIAAPAGRQHSVFAQRGTNGIDGALSHAAGIARATQRKTCLICGDLAFLHDLHGLLLVRDTENLSIFVLNNNGGGIFHFLPIAAHGEPFEQIHGTPHATDIAAFCKGAGLTCVHIAHPAQMEMAMTSPDRRVFEIITERAANHTAHQAMVAELLRAISA